MITMRRNMCRSWIAWQNLLRTEVLGQGTSAFAGIRSLSSEGFATKDPSACLLLQVRNNARSQALGTHKCSMVASFIHSKQARAN